MCIRDSPAAEQECNHVLGEDLQPVEDQHISLGTGVRKQQQQQEKQPNRQHKQHKWDQKRRERCEETSLDRALNIKILKARTPTHPCDEWTSQLKDSNWKCLTLKELERADIYCAAYTLKNSIKGILGGTEIKQQKHQELHTS